MYSLPVRIAARRTARPAATALVAIILGLTATWPAFAQTTTSLTGVSVGSTVTATGATATVSISNASDSTVHAQYRKVGDSTWTALSAQSTSAASVGFELSGLTSSTDYEVQASLAATYTDPQEVRFRTLPATGASDPPPNVTIEGRNGSLVVRWDAPTNNGESAITGYKVQYRTDEETFTPVARSLSVSATGRSATIRETTDDTEYHVRVIATNAQGDSAPSTVVTGMNRFVAPGPPTITRLVSEDHEITVHWAPPEDDGGDTIESYVLVQKPSSGDEDAWRRVKNNALDRLLPGVNPFTIFEHASDFEIGVSYDFRIRAFNGLRRGEPGNREDALGEWSPVVTITAGTPGRPGGPIIESVAPGGERLTVTWAPPSDTGMTPITGYDLEWVRHDSFWAQAGRQTFVATARTHTITGLDNDQLYRVRIRANNDTGIGDWTRATATPAAPGIVTLSALTLEGASVPGFAANRTDYEIGVENSIDVADIVATPTESTATVTCGTDNDMNAEGCQVPLSANDDTEATVTVTSGSASAIYTITINRGRSGDYEWKASQDSYAFANDNGDIGRGLWSDGTTMWAAITIDGVPYLRAVDLATGQHLEDQDVALRSANHENGARNSTPQGITDVGGELWVADGDDLRVYDYVWRNNGWVPDTSAGDSPPGVAQSSLRGIWSDGETLWVASDSSPGRIYAYDIAANEPLHSEDFDDLSAAGNQRPAGIWSDGVTMWVSDVTDKKIYAYDLVTKVRVPGRDFDLDVKGTDVVPWGLWSDGRTMWVLEGDEHIYSFRMPTSANTELRYVRANGADIDGFDRDETTMSLTVANDLRRPTITIQPRHFLASTAISSTDASATDGHQIDLGTSASTLNFTVTAQDGTTNEAYTLTFGRLPAAVATPVVTPADRSLVVGWTAPDAGTSDVSAYDLRYARTTASNLDRDSRWTTVADVWTTGMGALSHTITNLSPMHEYYVQVRAKNASGAGPWQPLATSGKGTPTTSGATDASLSALSVSPGMLEPAFPHTSNTHAVDIETGITTLTINATATDSNATISYFIVEGGNERPLSDADAIAMGHQVTLAKGPNQIIVRVTAEDDLTVQDYTINADRERASTDAALSALSLRAADGTALGEGVAALSPAFRTDRANYTASVANEFWRLTVAAEATDDGATVVVRSPADADTITDGHQVDLTVGTTTVRVRVTAEDGQTTEDYQITITRAIPVVSVTPAPVDEDDDPLVEGDTVEFVFSRAGAAPEALTVTYDLVGTGVTEANNLEITIPANAASVTLDVPTIADDDWDPHHSVGMRFRTPYSGYTLGTITPAQVLDDDFPHTDYSVTVSPTTASEGSSVTLTVSFETYGATEPHASPGPLRITTSPRSAVGVAGANRGTDYTAPPGEFTLEPGDFTLNTDTNDYEATWTTTIALIADGIEETRERFRVTVSKVSGETSDRLLGVHPTTADVTINASEAASNDATLSALTASPARINETVAADTAAYTATVARTVTQVTLAATATDSDASVAFVEAATATAAAIPDADGNAGNGLQAALNVGENTIVVRITAADTTTIQYYTLTITRTPSSVSTLGTLALSEGTNTVPLSSTFAPDRQSYTATVGTTVDEVTITATATDADATGIEYFDKDDNALTDRQGGVDGFQVALALGANTIKVVVTAEDASTTTYTLIVTRSSGLPEASISAAAGAADEGDAVTFTVTIPEAQAEDLVVNLTVSEDADGGDMVAAANEGAKAVTITAGDTEATYSVVTVSDTDWEEHSTITVEIATPNPVTYTVSGTAGSAVKEVRDDDFPLSDVALAVDAETVNEGDRVTVTVTMTTRDDEQPHAKSGTVTVRSRDGTATTPADYRALAETDVSFAASAFTRVDLDPEPNDEDFRWQASREFTIQTAQELVVEEAETFDIVMEADSTSDNIDKLTLAGTPATVTIRTSDYPEVSVSAPASIIREGRPVDFTVSLAQNTLTDLVVNLAVSEAADGGDMVAAGNEGEKTVTIAANSRSATFRVETVGDTTWEHHSALTVAVADGTGYSISQSAGTVTKEVLDDDLADSTLTLTAIPNSVDEGGTVLVRLRLAVDEPNMRPHTSSGRIRVFTEAGTASAADFTALNETITFHEAEFVDERVGELVFYDARRTLRIPITVDTIPEGDERFVVKVEKVAGQSGTNPGVTRIPPDIPITIPGTLPNVTIESLGSAAITEGQPARFLVRRRPATSEALEVSVNVSDTGSFVAAANTGARTVTIPANQGHVEFTVPTVDDDAWDEQDGDDSDRTTTLGVRAILTGGGDTYAVDTNQHTAIKAVRDNDFPDATLTLSGVVNPAPEGTNSELTYRFLTDDDQKPHKGTGQFALSIMAGTATIGPTTDEDNLPDVLEFELRTLMVTEPNFTRVDIDSGPGEDWRWQAGGRTSTRLFVVDDDDEEEAETFSLNLVRVHGVDVMNPGDPNIVVTNPGTITIPANDGSDESEDVTLSALTLSSGPLSPAFQAGGTDIEFTAFVPWSVTQVTVAATATASADGAIVAYRSIDADAIAPGHQVNLSEGENAIEVEVTAEDDRYEQVYTITVTRGPRVSIGVASETPASPVEGENVVFTVTRSSNLDDDLDVIVAVSERGGGDVVDSATEGRKTVTIAGGDSAAMLTVKTEDDTTWEAHSTVQAMVVAGTGYEAHTTANTASRQVQDDDLPSSQAEITVSATDVREADAVTVTVTVTTDGDQEPHGGTGPFRLYTEPGTAIAADYSGLDEQVSFDPGDFSSVTINGGTVRRATLTRTIRITQDTLPEGAETFNVRLASLPATHAALSVVTAPAAITIDASDGDDATLSGLALTLAGDIPGRMDGDSVGRMSPSFDKTKFAYTANVGYTIEQITVTAPPTDANATVAFLRGNRPLPDADGDPDNGHQVDLDVGDGNVISVRVTAQNGTARQTYTVTVTRTEEDLSLTPATSTPSAPYPTEVTYNIRFQGRWNRSVTPGGLPTNAHFSPLIGGVHNADVTFLESGELASTAIESMAELGGTTLLRNAVNAAIADGTALGVINPSGNINPGATKNASDVPLTSEFPLVTLTSMIAPSHDWFVGVSGLPLMDSQGRWLSSHSVSLFPWDAGTEDGEDFTLGDNAPSDPLEPIHSLRGVGRFTTSRIALLTFDLHSVSTTRELEENTPASRNVGAPVSSPVAPPDDTGVITYSLAGPDADRFDIFAGTGQLRTKAGVTYNFEEQEAYEVTVVATDTGPDPDVVTNIQVTVAITNLDEPGTVRVVPGTPVVNALLTASLTDPDGEVTGASWQWQRSDDGTSNWTDITGATSTTYTPVTADQGKYLRVRVSYDDPEASGKSAELSLGQVEQRALSSDNALTALELSGITLDPAVFAPATTTYSATVVYATAQTTLTATEPDGAAVEILDGSGNDASPIPDADGNDGNGHQVALAVGSNTIVVRVTAEDGNARRDYTITVTRGTTEVSIEGPSSAAEGTSAEFTVTRSPSAADALEVLVAVTETGTGDLVAEANQKTHRVTISGGASEGTLAIPLVQDTAWEEHTTVTATIQASDDYTIETGEGSATTAANDDDFPAATAVLSVTPLVGGEARVREGANVTATLTVTTTADQQPHADGGVIQLSTANGTAAAGTDYTALSAAAGALEFEMADLTRQDVDGAMRYRHSETVTITTTDDTAPEGDETFTVSMARVTAGEKQTHAAITLDTASTVTVTIGADDQSGVDTLDGLGLRADTVAVPLNETFAPLTTTYTADVEFGVETITVTPDPSDPGAVHRVLDDSDQLLGDTDSVDVALAVGETTFKVEVTAQDSSRRTYTVTVTRGKPQLTLGVNDDDLTEGDSVVFTVERNGSTTESTTFTADVTVTGGQMVDSGLGTGQSYTILTGEDSIEIALATTGDTVWEAHATVTLTLTAGSAYDIPTPATIEKVVRDDDFPSATASLTFTPNPVTERDGTVAVTVTIQTNGDEQPHGPSGSIQITTMDGTALAGRDYTALSTPVSFDGQDAGGDGDFIRIDIDPDPTDTDFRWIARKSVNISITADGEGEDDETFTVSLLPVTTGPESTRTSSALDLSGASRTVTISQNDRSTDASLSGLTLSAGGQSVPVSLAPSPFDRAVFEYNADVAFGHTRVTVVPATGDAAATVEVLDSSDMPLDDDLITPGSQVDLLVETAKEVRVQVTAEAGNTAVYTFMIKRRPPELTISVEGAGVSAIEGAGVVVTVTRNGEPPETTPFNVIIRESGGDMVADSSEDTATTHIIQADDPSLEFTVPTQLDDEWEPHSTIEVELQAGSYTIRGSATVSKVVTDDDFPAAVVALDIDRPSVDEGQTVTATVTVTIDGERQPHESGGVLRLSTADGSATAGQDYNAITGTAGDFALDISAFTLEDIGGGQMGYRATREFEITTRRDDENEGEETFTVEIASISADPMITLPTPSFQTVTFKPSDQEDDAALGSLDVSADRTDLTLSPSFSSDVLSYSVAVPFAHSRVTIMAEPSSSRASLAYLQSDASTPFVDADLVAGGLQVDLATVGVPVVVTITVTAQNTVAMQTYTLTLTRQQPVASIGVDDTQEVVEGGDVEFTVTLDGNVEDAAGVTVNVNVSGSMVASPGARTVVIAQGDDSGTLTVTTAGDEVWEEHSDVTAALTSGTGYTVTTDGGAASASHQVLDDDFPQATAVLSVSPNPIDEGGTATVAVTITTTDDHEPREGGGSIVVTTADGTALDGADYTAVPAAGAPLNFERDTFDRVDIDDDLVTEDFRWRARLTATVPIIDDTEEEPAETFTVAMAAVTTGTEPMDSAITLDTTTETTVTINANDEHRVTGVRVVPTDHSATVTVEIVNPSESARTVHLRYKPSTESIWIEAPSEDTSGTEATLTLDPLPAQTQYDIEASLDSTFPAERTEDHTFSTLGSGASVSRIEFSNLSRTGATAEVFIANSDGTTERTVLLRYRRHDETSWTDASPEPTTAASAEVELTGLTSGTEYHVEATIEADFDSGNVQSNSFTTEPPAVAGATVDVDDITDSVAPITVSVSAPNGDEVHLRYRVRGSDWHTVPGQDVAADAAGTTFDLSGLTSGETYDVQASYDRTFPETDATRSLSLVTATPDDPGRIVEFRDTRSTGGGGGGFAGGGIGGGGGGGPSGPTPSEVDFEWTVEHDIDELDSGHDVPTGMWSDGATLWLLDNPDGTGDAVYAYSIESGERAGDHDFELSETNRAPRGVWSDRTTIWIADSGPDRLFAHDIATGERTPERDIELDDRNADPRGIWSDGETMWVLDNRRNALFAYDLGSGELLGEYTLADANDGPHGLWSDLTTIWVSNHDPKQLFAYRLPRVPEQPAAEAADPIPLERVRDEDFTSPGRVSNNSPRGIWSDGQVMYVADENDGKVYSYNMPDAIDARLTSLSLEGVDIGEFDPGQTDYEGIPDDGVTQTAVAAEPAQDGASVDIEPVDADDDARGHQVALAGAEEIVVAVTSADGSRERLYRVSLPTPSEDDFAWNGERDIEQLDPENDRPTGLWSDGATLWVIEDGEGSGGAVYAYDLASGERAEEREFALDETNRAPRGVWSDSVTVWVSDSDQGRLFAYDLGTGERVPERDIEIDDRNGDPRGIWSDGETMWVLDGDTGGVFAYDLGSGELLGECALDPANDDPRGVWSDHTTIWVSNHDPKHLFAYRLPTRGELAAAPGDKALERVRDEEFTELSKANNNSPRGIWSDGDVMYVADENDGRVYSYNMPDAIDARLASLSLQGVDIGEFSPARTEYEGVPGDGVTETTVAAEAAQSGGNVDIWPADADEDADDHQIALAGIEAITVTVTSPDESRRRLYRVSLPTPSEDDFAWNGERDIEQLDPENDRPTGLWSDGATLWVIENGEGSGGAVYAYDLETGERLEEHEFALDETNRIPRGIWSDRVTVWVSDSDQDRLFAYDPGTGERTPERDIELDDRNGAARGIWSDGEAMWVLDADGVFAYDLGSGALLGEYTLAGANSEPRGIWSDHTTIWVSNDDPKRLFAYRLPRVPEQPAAGAAEPTLLERVQDEEFTELSKANNNSPRGLWSDGDVMYVADANDGRVYSYNVPDAWDARLASLALSGVEIGEFDPRRTGYEGTVGDGVTRTTVAAEAAQDGASVETWPADADEDADGHQVDLGGAREITVTVTSADGSREQVYRVALTETGPPASCLSSDVAVGFSLVIYEGGSVEELESCAQSRHVTALYALDDGEFVSYILGAPGFVNERFGELYADGVPELTPLTVKSDGPATADPGALVVTEPWTSCLRGEIVQGFSHVLHEGGSVDDLTACAQSLGVTALYALDGGSWVSYILGAPDFVSRSFRELFADGVAVATPLVARSE